MNHFKPRLIVCLVLVHAAPLLGVAQDLMRMQPPRGPVIDYFSAEGQGLARRRNIPPPPIADLPTRKLDPPRNVEAHGWTAPFCKTWTDGCDTCTRARVTGRPRCNRLTDDTACRRHDVWCTRNVSPDLFFAFCSSSDTYDVAVYGGGKIERSFSAFASATWIYGLEDANPRWQYSIAEDAILPARRDGSPPGPRPKAVYTDTICQANMSHPRTRLFGDGVLIELP